MLVSRLVRSRETKILSACIVFRNQHLCLNGIIVFNGYCCMYLYTNAIIMIFDLEVAIIGRIQDCNIAFGIYTDLPIYIIDRNIGISYSYAYDD